MAGRRQRHNNMSKPETTVEKEAPAMEVEEQTSPTDELMQMLKLYDELQAENYDLKIQNEKILEEMSSAKTENEGYLKQIDSLKTENESYSKEMLLQKKEIDSKDKKIEELELVNADLKNTFIVTFREFAKSGSCQEENESKEISTADYVIFRKRKIYNFIFLIVILCFMAGLFFIGMGIGFRNAGGNYISL